MRSSPSPTRLLAHVSQIALPARHHYSSAPTSRIASPSIAIVRPRILPPSSFRPIQALSSVRHHSTASPTAEDNGATTSSSTAPSQLPTPLPLTWTDFFALRKRRRLTNLVASSVSGTVSLFVGAAFLSSADLDGLGAQKFGLDPIMFAGILTMACGSLGWLAGPFVGNGVWRIANRGRVEVFNFKEKAFYDRIKRYRADPASQSVNNPVPDYYGEKIGSVAAYRQWLKDQRAFTKKRQM